MDQIRIENLEVYAAHGVYPKETRQGQLFKVDVTLNTDTGPAGLADDLALSTNYGEVSRLIQRYLWENTFSLIEAAAEHLAREILLSFPRVESLALELKKPQAPVKIPFSNISVRIERGWHQAWLGIGSNMGDRKAYIDQALAALEEKPEIRQVRCSRLITTAPYGGVEQEDFLNGAVGLKTLLSPQELLAFLQELEHRAGRERKIHWGPRTLDLDILFFEGFVSDDPLLTVPHPDMENRGFVLEPLDELCPWLRHPLNGRSVRQMRQELEKRGEGAALRSLTKNASGS